MNLDLSRDERSEKAPVTPAHIRAAHALIEPHIRRTPLLELAWPIPGAPPLSLKLE